MEKDVLSQSNRLLERKPLDLARKWFIAFPEMRFTLIFLLLSPLLAIAQPRIWKWPQREYQLPESNQFIGLLHSDTIFTYSKSQSELKASDQYYNMSIRRIHTGGYLRELQPKNGSVLIREYYNSDSTLVKYRRYASNDTMIKNFYPNGKLKEFLRDYPGMKHREGHSDDGRKYEIETWALGKLVRFEYSRDTLLNGLPYLVKLRVANYSDTLEFSIHDSNGKVWYSKNRKTEVQRMIFGRDSLLITIKPYTVSHTWYKPDFALDSTWKKEMLWFVTRTDRNGYTLSKEYKNDEWIGGSERVPGPYGVEENYYELHKGKRRYTTLRKRKSKTEWWNYNYTNGKETSRVKTEFTASGKLLRETVWNNGKKTVTERDTTKPIVIGRDHMPARHNPLLMTKLSIRDLRIKGKRVEIDTSLLWIKVSGYWYDWNNAQSALGSVKMSDQVKQGVVFEAEFSTSGVVKIREKQGVGWDQLFRNPQTIEEVYYGSINWTGKMENHPGIKLSFDIELIPQQMSMNSNTN